MPLMQRNKPSVFLLQIRSVARKETLDVHQKNWVCHIYCQINANKKKKKSMLIGY